ncbi:His-Xaa-Ser system radical SAM maturase HxsB [Candidatus Gracilibacteria bacterium]|nr:His-Xaa-Ser system radical SAM maturase HxsB [Candidatus Gracilibacteria bacterium]
MKEINKNIPFIRFNHLSGDKIVMTNIFGESIVLKNEEFDDYIAGNKLNSKLKQDLEDKFFFKTKDYENNSIDKYLKRNYINFTGPTLHIVVLTKGCNHQCKYCHASADYRYSDESLKLNKDNGKKIIDIILSSPSKNLTIEFQGGEPLTNMELIDFLINYSELQNKKTKKSINYALVSNLTLINDEILEKLFSYPNLSISTSLDGDKKVHDFNRLMISDKKAISSFDSLSEKIFLIRKKEQEKGKKILFGAMGVITKKTLDRYKELVETYISFGFDNIFLKKLNNIGYGEKSINTIGYTNEQLLDFYKNYFSYLIEKNKSGVFIRDGFIDIAVKKILDPEKINFMDLRSPCGAGVGQIAYDYTGNIYTCDEGRMIEGDVFKIGTTNNTLEELIQNETVGIMMDASTVESLPCDICAYAPFCGVCPIESYQTRGNIYTNQVFDDHCSFFTFLYDYVFEIFSEKKGDEYNFLKKYIS